MSDIIFKKGSELSPALNIKRIDWSLYAILDEQWRKGREIQSLAKAAIRGGVTVLQYRNKRDESRSFYEKAKVLSAITNAWNVPLIINDRTDIALAVDADGVHMGQQDLPVAVVRQLIGPDRIIGLSISEPDQLSSADSADYLGVGSVYPTESKENVCPGGVELLQTIRGLTALPVVGIGGINAGNLEPVIRSACNGVSVISAIFGAEDVEGAARELRQAIDRIRASE